MNEVITSRQNKHVRHIRKLLEQKKYRDETGLFAAEGIKLFGDAMKSGAEIETVLCTEDALSSPDFPESAGGVVGILSAEVFGYVSTQQSPQGVIFSAKKPEQSAPGLDRCIILDSVQDPGNLGTILRTAAAFGISGILLHGDCADPYGHKAVRASMGAVLRAEIHPCSTEQLKALLSGKRIAAAMPDAETGIREMDWSGTVPVIGNEGNGVSDELLAICGCGFSIPMAEGAESLNAAVAASIIMWEMSGTRFI